MKQRMAVSKICLVMMTFGFIKVDSQSNESSVGVNVTSSKTRKCAESFCLPDSYDKLEVPFNESGVVLVSVDFDTLQVMASRRFSERSFSLELFLDPNT